MVHPGAVDVEATYLLFHRNWFKIHQRLWKHIACR